MDYREILRNEVCEVVFTKKDGSERNMFCTLHPDILPIQENITEKDKLPSDTVITVWDIEADGWRSFRVDTIKSFEVVTEK